MTGKVKGKRLKLDDGGNGSSSRYHVTSFPPIVHQHLEPHTLILGRNAFVFLDHLQYTVLVNCNILYTYSINSHLMHQDLIFVIWRFLRLTFALLN